LLTLGNRTENTFVKLPGAAMALQRRLTASGDPMKISDQKLVKRMNDAVRDLRDAIAAITDGRINVTDAEVDKAGEEDVRWGDKVSDMLLTVLSVTHDLWGKRLRMMEKDRLASFHLWERIRERLTENWPTLEANLQLKLQSMTQNQHHQERRSK
jgi:hypothetical protein